MSDFASAPFATQGFLHVECRSRARTIGFSRRRCTTSQRKTTPPPPTYPRPRVGPWGLYLGHKGILGAQGFVLRYASISRKLMRDKDGRSSVQNLEPLHVLRTRYPQTKAQALHPHAPTSRWRRCNQRAANPRKRTWSVSDLARAPSKLQAESGTRVCTALFVLGATDPNL